jgi:polysaccharide export outer membrane protein
MWYHSLVAAGSALLLSACGSSLPSVTTAQPEAAVMARPFEVPPTMLALQSFTERSGFPEYVMGPGDELELTLRDIEIVKETVTIRPDGNISFGLVENVTAANLTPTELDELLSRELSRFLRSPKIDVEVVEYNSKVVSLLGSVQSLDRSAERTGQGRYPLKTKTTVLDLILEAGGSAPEAQLDEVQLIRTGSTYELDIQQALNTGNNEQNVLLQGDDIVIVRGTNLLSKKVVVLGEVERPNVYRFPEQARILEAVSQAGGLTPNALRDDVRLIRVDNGTTTMYRMNLARLVNRGDFTQNITLQNDDIIYVPRSFIGDVNDVITKIEPLLNILLLPATYRDLYTTGSGLRLDTGESVGGSAVFTTLPGTAGKTTATTEQSASEEGDADGGGD